MKTETLNINKQELNFTKYWQAYTENRWTRTGIDYHPCITSKNIKNS